MQSLKEATTTIDTGIEGEVAVDTAHAVAESTPPTGQSLDALGVALAVSDKPRAFDPNAAAFRFSVQPEETTETKQTLLQQLEFFFSPMNLTQDTYLVSQMNADHYVPCAFLASFPTVKSITKDLSVVISTLRESKLVELDSSGTLVRSRNPIDTGRRSIILRDIPSATPEADVRALFSSGPVPVSLKADILDSWFINFATEDDAQGALTVIKKANFRGRPVNARMKTASIVRNTQPRNPGLASAGFPAAAYVQAPPYYPGQKSQYYDPYYMQQRGLPLPQYPGYPAYYPAYQPMPMGLYPPPQAVPSFMPASGFRNNIGGNGNNRSKNTQGGKRDGGAQNAPVGPNQNGQPRDSKDASSTTLALVAPPSSGLDVPPVVPLPSVSMLAPSGKVQPQLVPQDTQMAKQQLQPTPSFSLPLTALPFVPGAAAVSPSATNTLPQTGRGNAAVNTRPSSSAGTNNSSNNGRQKDGKDNSANSSRREKKDMGSSASASKTSKTDNVKTAAPSLRNNAEFPALPGSGALIKGTPWGASKPPLPLQSLVQMADIVKGGVSSSAAGAKGGKSTVPDVVSKNTSPVSNGASSVPAASTPVVASVVPTSEARCASPHLPEAISEPVGGSSQAVPPAVSTTGVLTTAAPKVFSPPVEVVVTDVSPSPLPLIITLPSAIATPTPAVPIAVPVALNAAALPKRSSSNPWGKLPVASAVTATPVSSQGGALANNTPAPAITLASVKPPAPSIDTPPESSSSGNKDLPVAPTPGNTLTTGNLAVASTNAVIKVLTDAVPISTSAAASVAVPATVSDNSASASKAPTLTPAEKLSFADMLKKKNEPK